MSSTTAAAETSWLHHTVPAVGLDEGDFEQSGYFVARRSVLAGTPLTAGAPARIFTIELHVDEARRAFRVVSSEDEMQPTKRRRMIRGPTVEARICSSLPEALAVFGSLFREREGALHRFTPLLLTSSLGGGIGGGEPFPSTLPASVQRLVRTVYASAAQQLGKESRSLVSLSSAQVDRGVAALLRIKALLDIAAQSGGGEAIDGVSALALSNEFFSALPTLSNNGAAVIDTAEKLEHWFDVCQMLRDVLDTGEATVSIDGAGNLRDVDLLARSLSCEISPLAKDSVEFSVVSQLLARGAGAKDRMRVLEVFSARRSMDSVAFAGELANQRLLFHGTRPAHLLGILSRGMLLPQICTGKYGAKRTGSMLGAGLYFAEDCAVSFKYTAPTSDGSRFMFVCLVALGKEYETTNPMPSLEAPPTGFDSVHALGGPTSSFEDDEFVVFSPRQQCLRYLIEFSLNDPEVPRSLDPGVFFRLGIDRSVKRDQSRGRKQPEEPRPEDPARQTPKRSYGLQSVSGESVPLERVNVHARLVDVVAEVTVFQQFSNNTSTALEAKYVFPLDEMSAVCAFEAFVNNKHVVGVVKEKEQAHKEFKEAVERGDGAYLLDEAPKDNVFTVSIGNIPPKTKVIIKIVYITELAVDGFTRKFVYPATLVPHQRQNASSVLTQGVTQTVAVDASDSFSLEVAVNMPFFVQQVTSPSHTILCKKSATKATVRWIEDAPPTIDFVLLVRIADLRMPSMWAEDSSIAGDERCAMVVLYPDLQPSEDVSAEYIVVLDLSNSMQSCFFDAKNVALGLLHGIPPQARLNVVAFGSCFETLFMASKPMSDSTLRAALAFCGQMKATWGASVLWPALKMLLLEIEYRDPEQKPMDTNIFLVSDFDFASPEQCRDLVSTHCRRPGNHTRVFSLAMGATPHRHNASSISRAGCGAVEYVGPSNQLSDQDRKQLSRAAQPSLGSITVSWETGSSEVVAVDQAPALVQSIFSGERLIIYGLVPPDCVRVRLQAKSTTGENFTAVAAFSPSTTTKGLLVHRLFTRAFVRDWEDGRVGGDSVVSSEIAKERMKSRVIDLGVKYSLATPLTSFIAVEERSEAEKRGLIVLPATPGLNVIDKTCVDEIPFCSSWERIEKALAVTATERPKIGSGAPCHHPTIYDFWEPGTEPEQEPELELEADEEEEDEGGWADSSSDESSSARRSRRSKMSVPKKAKRKKGAMLAYGGLPIGSTTAAKASSAMMEEMGDEIVDVPMGGEVENGRSDLMSTIRRSGKAAKKADIPATSAPSSRVALPPSRKDAGPPRSPTSARARAQPTSGETALASSSLSSPPPPPGAASVPPPPPPPPPPGASVPPPPGAPCKPAAPPPSMRAKKEKSRVPGRGGRGGGGGGGGRGGGFGGGAPPPPPPAPAQLERDMQDLNEIFIDVDRAIRDQSMMLDEIDQNIECAQYEFAPARAYAAKSASAMACFIATAAYGSPLDPRINSLRWFRDHILARFAAGRAFTAAYYALSPPFAKWLARHDAPRAVVRTLLWPLVFFIDYPWPFLTAFFSVLLLFLMV